MFNTSGQILQQFLAGEDSHAEFKEIRFVGRGVISPSAEEIAGDLVAFANAEGGVEFLGVDDSGTVLGIPSEKLGEVEQWILNIASHHCDPPIHPDLRKVLLPGTDGKDQRVLLVEVPRGLYVHRTSGGRYYTRIGSTKRNLTSPELARLFQQRGREYVFDEQPVFTATVDDLNRNRLEAFFGRSPTIPWLDLLRNTRVTFQDESGVDRPTIAGLLVFATEPTMFLASGSIEAACYHGTRLSSDDLIHDERLAGPVSDQIDAGIAFVTRFMQTGNSSEARIQYDIDVVDEAIVNAVAHRDYAISGSKSVYSCSLTGWSYTALVDCLTPSHWRICPTARLPVTNFSSTSCRGYAVNAPGRYSWSHEVRAYGRSLKTGKHTRAVDPGMNCLAMNSV